MQIRLENIKENATSFMRTCGYALERQTGRELSFIRRLRGYNYPRFHTYTYVEDGILVINLHLDQKKPSYEGTNAHSGEYDGALVEAEAERIRSFAN